MNAVTFNTPQVKLVHPSRVMSPEGQSPGTNVGYNPSNSPGIEIPLSQKSLDRIRLRNQSAPPDITALKAFSIAPKLELKPASSAYKTFSTLLRTDQKYGKNPRKPVSKLPLAEFMSF